MFLERTAISLAAAQQKIKELTITKRTKRVAVTAAHGLVLAETITAPFPQPSFRRSGYDGYGITAADDGAFPITLRLAAEVPAGATFQQKLVAGETVRIMTGAQVPEDVVKVIMLEKTEQLPDGKVLFHEGSRSDNITPIGAEFPQGATLLTAGQRMNAGAISLLSAFGINECLVYEKPRVAVLATGTELLAAGSAPEAGKIYNSNGPLLAALVAENGGALYELGQIADEMATVEETLQRLAQEVDLIITTGGVSVGDFDFLAVAAQDSGQLLFNKLAMRPGSPTTAFVYENTPVLALSGNPGACFTGFYLLVEPLLQAFQGQESRLRQTTLKLAHDYRKKNNFDRYLRGTWREETVALVGSDQSSALGNLHLTTCFFKIPHEQELTAGEEVQVWCLPCK